MFDEKRLDKYYTNHFVSDLEDYFSIPNDTNEIKYVGKPHWPSNIFYHSSAEHQMMFIALTSYMLSAEEVLMRRIPSSPNYEFYECLNMFGFPIAPITKARYGLEAMLRHYEIAERLWCFDGEVNSFLQNMAANLVPIRKDGTGIAHYDSSKDVVHLPAQKQFPSYADYAPSRTKRARTSTTRTASSSTRTPT